MNRRARTGKETQAEEPESSSKSDGTIPGGGAGRDANDIARRAYEKFEARGYADGGDVEDWLAAERELNEAGRGTGDVE
jgi:Protein of unknown function (DUF2934)